MYVCAAVYCTQCMYVRTFTALNVRVYVRLPHSMYVCAAVYRTQCVYVLVVGYLRARTLQFILELMTRANMPSCMTLHDAMATPPYRTLPLGCHRYFSSYLSSH